MRHLLLLLPFVCVGQISNQIVENVPLTIDAGYNVGRYTWSLNGREIPGATNRIYYLETPQEADAGTYVVKGPALMRKFTFTFVKAVSVQVNGKTVAGDVVTITGPSTITLVPYIKGLPVRYTIDGTEPTPSSPLYSKPFVINQNVVIRASIIIPEGDSTKIVNEDAKQGR